MKPAADTELLYHTLDLDARVRKYARHLHNESMLAKLNKEDVIAKYHIWCLVNESLQLHQTRKGENLTKNKISALLIRV